MSAYVVFTTPKRVDPHKLHADLGFSDGTILKYGRYFDRRNERAFVWASVVLIEFPEGDYERALNQARRLRTVHGVTADPFPTFREAAGVYIETRQRMRDEHRSHASIRDLDEESLV